MEVLVEVITSLFAENYSIYGVEIELTRVLSPYLLSVYLPSAMFVSMSWVRDNLLTNEGKLLFSIKLYHPKESLVSAVTENLLN